MIETKTLENNIVILKDEKDNYLKITTKPSKSFMFEDIKWLSEELFKSDNEDIKFIEVLSLFVKPELRRQKYGTKLLRTLTTLFGSDHIIFLKAGALEDEYKEEPSREEYDILFDKLEKFYSYNNFLDINDKCGQYEDSIVFVYDNKYGRRIKNCKIVWDSNIKKNIIKES